MQNVSNQTTSIFGNNLGDDLGTFHAAPSIIGNQNKQSSPQ